MSVTKHKKLIASICALVAAVFYAVNTPISKLLLDHVPPVYMASFLYLGAGLGVGIMYLFHFKKERSEERLSKKDWPYTVAMAVLDIVAPVLLMIGIRVGSAANASLLGNFEIVATTLIALALFGEAVSGRLWLAIVLITGSSLILSFDGNESLHFSWGSILVILAASCWGLENNCTRKISDKSTYEIVVIKGIFSGFGALIIAMIIGEVFPGWQYLFPAMLLGFIAYGLSIFLYIRAQRELGAAKTSAYYAVAPFIGSFLAFAVNGEKLTQSYILALIIMLVGTACVVYDTMMKHHRHGHTHRIIHAHNSVIHTHVITHEHGHDHFMVLGEHRHSHRGYLLSQAHRETHRQKDEEKS